MKRCSLPLGLALTLGLCVATKTDAAPQTFNTALPVAKNEFVFREQFVLRRASDDPSLADRELQVFAAVSVLGYGVTADIAVFGVLPILDKNLQLTAIDGHLERDTSGIADASVIGRYTLYKDNAPGRTLRIAPFLGIELPTGDDNDSDSNGSLPAPLQLGSGSWDPFLGIVLTYQKLDYQIDLQASYKANTEADGFDRGDEIRFDASLQYRIWPTTLDVDPPGFLYAVLEGNLMNVEPNVMSGVKNANSGGTSLFLSPGLQYVTRRWIIEGIIQLPVLQNLRGAALRDDFSIRAGFRFNF